MFAMPSYPSRLIPPPARWQGQVAHVGVADYEPENGEVFMRLYYPTSNAPSRFSRAPLWVPNLHYAHGMAHFLVDFTDPKRTWWQKLLARAAYLAGYVSNTVFDTIPVSLDAPAMADKPMKLVVFSHGLAGTRNMYAALCSALASQGYLVAAVEHRDGSAAYTSVTQNGNVRHKPYVHTDGNFVWRREQIGTRVAELHAALRALGSTQQPKNVCPHGKFDISAFQGKIDTSSVIAIGHSFGGTTVLAATAKRATKKSISIKRVVLLDPWTAPFGPCVDGAEGKDHPLRLAAAANLPVFVMNSHGWGADLTHLYKHANATWVQAEVHGAKHQDFSDLPLRSPWLAKKIGMKGSVDAAKFFDLKLGLIDLFLEAVEGAESAEALGVATRELAAQYAGVRVDVKHRE